MVRVSEVRSRQFAKGEICSTEELFSMLCAIKSGDLIRIRIHTASRKFVSKLSC